jgi:hypothetical protein
MSKSSTTTKAIATPNRVTAHSREVLSEELLKPLAMRCKGKNSHWAAFH